jgi:hypothetical protein
MAINALRSIAGFGWQGWGGNQKLVSEVAGLQTREVITPACRGLEFESQVEVCWCNLEEKRLVGGIDGGC